MEFKIKDVILSEDEIQKRIKELAKEISEEYKDDDPLFLPILNGSFMFASDLLRNIPYPVEVEFLKASSYLNQLKSTGKVNISNIKLDIEGRDVIIIEDILDTGRTLNYIVEFLKNQGAKSVKSVVLLDKPDGRVIDFNPDYTGFEIEDNFVVGYGTDYKQHGRNLPYIVSIEED